jgi:hypothetical protein
MYLCGGEAFLIELGRFNLPVAQPTAPEKGEGERPGLRERAMVEGAGAIYYHRSENQPNASVRKATKGTAQTIDHGVFLPRVSMSLPCLSFRLSCGCGADASRESRCLRWPASRRRQPCTAPCAVPMAEGACCRPPGCRRNVAAPPRPARARDKPSGSVPHVPPILRTAPTNERATTTGNPSIPSPGASIANSVPTTGTAIGCGHSTGTTNVGGVRWHRWRGEQPSASGNRACPTSAPPAVHPWQRWPCSRNTVMACP